MTHEMIKQKRIFSIRFMSDWECVDILKNTWVGRAVIISNLFEIILTRIIYFELYIYLIIFKCINLIYSASTQTRINPST